MTKLLPALFVLCSMQPMAQEAMETGPEALKSIDGIVWEVLSILSGEEGKVQDWDVFRNLFLPTATFTVLYHSDGFPRPYEMVGLEDFISMMYNDYHDKGLPKMRSAR